MSIYKGERARHSLYFIHRPFGARVRISYGNFVYPYLAVFLISSSWTNPIAKRRDTGNYNIRRSANNCNFYVYDLCSDCNTRDDSGVETKVGEREK